MYRVMFCCNDERGMFAGRVAAVEIQDEVSLIWPSDREPVMRWTERPRYTNVQVGRRAFACTNRQSCVGNVFWDSADMTAAQACALVEHLIASGWLVEMRADDGPFAVIAAPDPGHSIPRGPQGGE
jgi:hypothetical protein